MLFGIEAPRLALVTMRTTQHGAHAGVDELLRSLERPFHVARIAAGKKYYTCHKSESFYHFAHRKGKMGEYDRRIAILRNLRQSAFDLADERFYVLRSDKRGEFGTESQLLAPEVADFIDARMEHVTLAQEARGIPQESTLLLARELCGIFGPGDEFQMLVVVA